MSDDVRYPLSARQSRLLELRDRAAAQAYRSCLVARIDCKDAAATAARLRARAQREVDAHEILRTAFESPSPMLGPVQSVIAEARLGDPDRCALAVAVDDRGDEYVQLSLHAPGANADACSLRTLLARIVGGGIDASRVDESALQYADIAEWQAELLSGTGEDADPEAIALDDAARAWWSNVELAAAADPSVFLVRHPGSLHFAPDESVADLPAGLWTRLGEALGSAPEYACLAAWQALLVRLGVEAGAVIGLESDGRGIDELVDAVGPLGRLLPARIEVDDAQSLAHNASACARSVMQATDFQHHLSAHVLAAAPLGYLPVAFSHERWSVPTGVHGIEILSCYGNVDRFDVLLALVERPHAPPRASLRFDASRIARASAERLLEQFVTLLEAAALAPAAPLATLPILPSHQRKVILETCSTSGATHAPPTVPLVHRAIERQARMTPDAPAVADTNGVLSYAELDLRANQLAHHLVAHGVEPGRRVAVHLTTSARLPVALLACLKVGAAYVPLDPAFGATRLERMLEDARISVRITEGECAGQMRFDGTSVVLDAVEPTLYALPGDAPTVETSESTVAYIMFTSGSTGRPKGVPVSHANLAYSNAARLHTYEAPATRFALASSHAFDSSVVGLYWPLLSGGCVHVLPTEARADAAAIAEVIETHRITHMLCLPSLYAHVLDAADRYALDTLHTVIVAGEACPASLAARHSTALPGTRLYNEYGPSEGTVWCSTHRCAAHEAGPVVSIGRPIGGSALYVLDAERQPLPIGAAGELWLAGPGVVDGYIDDVAGPTPFADNPFDGAPSRMYRTGDRARWREDGTLEFLGRADEQIKVRGFRVEPAEVAAALGALPGVLDVAVVAVPADEAPDADDLDALVDTLAQLDPNLADELVSAAASAESRT